MAALEGMPNVYTADGKPLLEAVEHIEYVRYGLARVQRRVLGEAFWAERFHFAFVRNPWDRYVSSWLGFRSKWSFAEYVDRVGVALESTARGYDSDRWHAISQRRHLVDEDGRSMVHFVGRFETLQRDFDRICDRMNVARAELPRLNASRHGHYSEYYTPELRKIVARRCEEDVDAFGYRFEAA